MSNTIDCGSMSHVSCFVEEESVVEGPPPPPTVAGPPASSGDSAPPGVQSLRDPGGQPVGSASYECVNDCVSSLGVTALLSGATVSLGCIMLPPACPAFIGASVGSVLGACEVACEDLESKA
jgi:hypothetical protein